MEELPQLKKNSPEVLVPGVSVMLSFGTCLDYPDQVVRIERICNRREVSDASSVPQKE